MSTTHGCTPGSQLILLVSLDFKTSWKMFTHRGGICNLIKIGHFCFTLKQSNFNWNFIKSPSNNATFQSWKLSQHSGGNIVFTSKNYISDCFGWLRIAQTSRNQFGVV